MPANTSAHRPAVPPAEESAAETPDTRDAPAAHRREDQAARRNETARVLEQLLSGIAWSG